MRLKEKKAKKERVYECEFCGEISDWQQECCGKQMQVSYAENYYISY
jgi:hypothetical protein